MAKKQITVRVKVDGSKVVQTFRLYGKEGERALGRIKGAAATSKAALQDHGRAAQQAGRAARGGIGGMRNLSLQLSQVAQQASATGDPLRALAIQLPDMAIGFGTLGIALGAIAGVALPLLVEGLFNSEASGADLEEQISALDAATNRYKTAVENLNRPMSDLREEFGTSAEAARRLFELQRDFAQVDMVTRLGEARQSLASQFGNIERVTEDFARSYAAAVERINELNIAPTNAQGISTLTDQQLQSRNNEVQALETIVRRVRPAIAAIKEELEISDQAAGEFLATLVRFREAQDVSGQLAALETLSQLYLSAASANGELSDEQRETLTNLLGSQEAMIAFEAYTSDAAVAAGETRDAVNSIDLSGQTSSAQLFAAYLGAAAQNAASAAAQLDAARRSDFERKLDNANPDFFDPRGGVDAPSAGQRPASILPKLPEPVSLSTRGAGGGRAGGGGGAARGLQELSAAARQAEQIINQARQAAVGYGDVVAELDQQLASGAISQDTYNRALDKAKERFSDLKDGADEMGRSFGDMVSGLVTGSNTIDQVLGQLGSRLLSGAFAQIFDSSGLGELFKGIDFFASGTSSAPGGLAVVGERGPELVNLPRGSQVMPAGQTQALMHRPRAQARGEGGGVVVINENYSGAPIQSRREQGPDGREYVINTIGDAMTQGDLDAPLAGRFSARPARIRR